MLWIDLYMKRKFNKLTLSPVIPKIYYLCIVYNI